MTRTAAQKAKRKEKRRMQAAANFKLQAPKTPWNPSSKAIARVKDVLPIPTRCHLCTGEEIEIVGHKEIYNGREYGEWPWCYRCKSCKAYVGMHPFTNLPLGTLADEALRQARKYGKEPFELLHKSGKMTRDQAYAELAAALDIPQNECHFGWFDEPMCWEAMEWAIEKQKELGIYVRPVSEE
jgi:hypothetical protein